MNISSNTFPSEIFEQLRMERMKQIFSGDFSFIQAIHEPRSIQRKVLRDTIQDIQGGKLQGRWDIDPAGGKTYMSLSLMAHVVKNGGRVLYLTPGNTELNNAIDSHLLKYKLGEDNFIKFENESDISSINVPKFKKVYDSVPYHYTTIQMLIYEERHKMIPADYYDLIVYDESQAFLGDIYSSTIPYFLGVGLFMSATPFTKERHLASIVPHRYGEISSEYLIKHHAYPKPELINCHVDEGSPENTSLPEIGDEFDFENNPEQRNLLNISERFQISEAIYEEIIISGDRKGLDFMPTVDDAEIFVKYIVPNNPILCGKVDFVAGRRGKKKNREIEAKLRSGELKVVLCKNIWYRSLDIPDITDIINNDPTRSLEKLKQRMGRGARPSPGKNKYRVWDVISSLFHAQKAGNPAIRAEESLPKTEKNKKKYALRSAHQEMSPEFIMALQRRRTESLLGVTSHEIHYRESLRKAYFLGDSSYALEVFLAFATQVFHVHPHQLMQNWNSYLSFSEHLEIDFNNERVVLDFQDFSDAIKFYGTKQEVEKYNWLKNISDEKLGNNVSTFDASILETVRKSRDTILEVLKEGDRAKGNIKMYEGKPDGRYISALNLYMQKHRGEIVWRERIYAPNRDTPIRFSFDVTLVFPDKNIEYKVGDFAESKKDARHFIARDIVEKILMISLEDENEVGESLNPNINSRVDLNNFLMTRGGKRTFIQTEKNEDMHIRHVLEIEIGGERYWFQDELFFPKTSDAQEHLAQIALSELSQKFSENFPIDPSIKAGEQNIEASERKSSVSLIHELVQKNKGNIIIESDKIGENTAKVALFGATIDIQMRGTSRSFSSMGDFTRKEQARENACSIAYNAMKDAFPKIEEFLPKPTKKSISIYNTLAEMKKKVENGGKLNARDIQKMREVKPGSGSLDYWWMLQFMFRKGLIGRPSISERPNYIIILIDGKNLGSHTKQKISSKAAIEKASEVAINNLLNIPNIQQYFIKKLQKQLSNS